MMASTISSFSSSDRGFSRLNNDAVRLFANGKYNESLPLLQSALREMRALAALKAEQQRAGSSAFHQKQQQQQQSSCDELSIQSMSLQPWVRSTTRGLENSCGYTFFDRMFLISSSNSNSRNVQDDDSSLVANDDAEAKICALLLYNLGIAYHQGGLVTGSTQELAKALKLYEMSLGFLQFQQQPQPTTEAEDEQDSDAILLSMALVNNVAHIQSTWFNRTETGHCITWLREAAQQLQPSQLGSNDNLFFFLHYFVMPNNDVFASPVA